MNDLIYGCDGCRTTLGRAGCAVHRDLSPTPGANFYITTCPHGLDLRLYPRCYLCRPVLTDSPLNVERLANAIWHEFGNPSPVEDLDWSIEIHDSPRTIAEGIVAQDARLAGKE